MFEQQLTLYEFNLNYLKMLLADLAESDKGASAFEGGNPPVWILGHLAVCTDYAAQLLGGEAVCPRAWHKQFAPGSNPAELAAPLPTKAELLAAIESGHRRVVEAMPAEMPAALKAPHSIELLKPTNLKTNADVLAHLMTTHVAFHLAQLSACRRKTGKGPIV